MGVVLSHFSPVATQAGKDLCSHSSQATVLIPRRMIVARDGSLPPSSRFLLALEGDNKINRICMSYLVYTDLLLTCNYIIRHMVGKINGVNWKVRRCILARLLHLD